MITLEVQECSQVEPLSLLIYGPHKMGKTELFANMTLRNNSDGNPLAFLIDLEDGSNYIKSRKAIIDKKLDEINQVKALDVMIQELNGLKNQGKLNIKYGIVDSVTKLLSLATLKATFNYMGTQEGEDFNRYSEENGFPYKKENVIRTEIVKGKEKHIYKPILPTDYKNFKYITVLPYGKGHGLVRLTFFQYISQLEKLEEDGGTTSAKTELDLMGKLKDMMSRYVDAIGKVIAKPNQRFISFVVRSNDTGTGGRCEYLRDKKVLVSEKIDDKISYYPENIYPSLKDIQ
jgi:hypothetical protein